MYPITACFSHMMWRMRKGCFQKVYIVYGVVIVVRGGAGGVEVFDFTLAIVRMK